ncbi:hypothetical protein GCM10009839_41200 [Catenulispora yoronensis]|uniref:Uncharacterized protein n=1 Tax=Catenulispora yoronensis TaxID=450799 RepID=A0ABN2UEW1_9ACTN
MLLVRLVPRVIPVRLVLSGLPVRQVPRDRRARPAHRVPRERPARLGRPVPAARQVRKGSKATRVLLA